MSPDQRLVENKKDRRAGLQRVFHPGAIHIDIAISLDIPRNKIQYLQKLQYLPKGDLEKAMGNKPMESMDRERACIPTLQVNHFHH